MTQDRETHLAIQPHHFTGLCAAIRVQDSEWWWHAQHCWSARNGGGRIRLAAHTWHMIACYRSLGSTFRVGGKPLLAWNAM